MKRKIGVGKIAKARPVPAVLGPLLSLQPRATTVVTIDLFGGPEIPTCRKNTRAFVALIQEISRFR